LNTNNITQTRCLYCSLACPVAVKQTTRGIFEPAYVDAEGKPLPRGLCYRGHYVCSLLTHPQRLEKAFEPHIAAKESRDYAKLVSQAAQSVDAAAISQSLAILISANFPTNQLEQVINLYRSQTPTKNICIFIPPTDLALLRGLARCKPSLADQGDITSAQNILAVGDCMGTHPVLAHSLLDFKQRQRKNILINIDTAKGRTMRFAEPGLQISPQHEVHALLALLLTAGGKPKFIEKQTLKRDDLLTQSGLTASEADKCVNLLREDKNSVIIITIPPGRSAQSEIIASAAASLAIATKSKLYPLFIYAGSPGAFDIINSFGLPAFTDWLGAAQEGKFQAMINLDVDLLSLFPAELIEPSLQNISCHIAASPMPNATTRKADMVFPLAFWFEMPGNIIDHQGQVIELSPLAQPPGGVQDIVEFVRKLSSPRSISKTNTSDLKPAGAARQNIDPIDCYLDENSPPDDDKLLLVSRTENLDLYEGSLSRRLDWVLTIEPEPYALIHPVDAQRFDLQNESKITLGKNGFRNQLRVRISDNPSPGTIAVSATIPETTLLFQWEKMKDNIEMGPAPVTLSLTPTEDGR